MKQVAALAGVSLATVSRVVNGGPQRPPRPRGAGPRGGRAARLPPQPDGQHAAPRRPAFGEHRPDLRGCRQPVLLRRAPRRRGRGPPARGADLRRQLRRAARARARAGRVVQRAARRRPHHRARRDRPQLPAARPRRGRGPCLRRSPGELRRRRRRAHRQRRRRARRGHASHRRTATGASPSSATGPSSTRPPSACAATATRSPATASRGDRAHARRRTTAPTPSRASCCSPRTRRPRSSRARTSSPSTPCAPSTTCGCQREVALVGFDDVALADVVEPGLTVVAQDAAALGRSAAELLFSRLDGYDRPVAPRRASHDADRARLRRARARERLMSAAPIEPEDVILVGGEALYDLVYDGDDDLAGPPGRRRVQHRAHDRRASASRSPIWAASRPTASARRLERMLAADGVRLDAVVRTDEPTTLALAELDETGSASYRFYERATSAPGPDARGGARRAAARRRDPARRHAGPDARADGHRAGGRRRGARRTGAGHGRPQLPPVGHRRRRRLPPAPAARARRAATWSRSPRRTSPGSSPQRSAADAARMLLQAGPAGRAAHARRRRRPGGDRRGRRAGARAARSRSPTPSAPATRSAVASWPGGARRASAASELDDQDAVVEAATFGALVAARTVRARGRLAPVPARARARRAAGAGRRGLARPPPPVRCSHRGRRRAQDLRRLRHPARGRARRHGRGLPRDRRAALGRRVALKVIVPELAADAQFRQRFEREARVAATLEHPHVVPVYEAGEQDGSLFIAMRFIDGRDLATEVRDHGRSRPIASARIVLQVAGALDAAHRSGVVHRDVKPANVLLTRHRRRRAGLPHRLRPHARGRVGERPDPDRAVGRHRRLRGARADPRRADRRALRRLRAGLPGLPGADRTAPVPRRARRARCSPT